MKIKDKCVCDRNFFIEHENACIIAEDESIHHVLDSNIQIGYKILECINCKKLYIARQHEKGKFEDIIPIEEFTAGDVAKFKIRNDKFSAIRFPDDVLQHMIK